MDSKIHKLLILLLFIAIPIAGLAFVTPDAHAFMFYSDATNDQGGCAQCHTGYRDNNNYSSLAEGVSWGDSLHNVHVRETTVGDNCDNCHGGAGTAGRTVNIGSSLAAPPGGNPIACIGCHEPTGLRAHHAINGVTLCAGCHPNDPTPPTEDVAPPWYGLVTNNISGTLLEPCNAAGEEQLAGLMMGLDNDGDNAYDTADSDCSCIPTGLPDSNCDGVDDDCNGTPDDAYVPMNTTCGIGVCASTGQTTCVDGVEGDTCVPGPQDEPTDVTCDGLDGDCDGQIDEDYIIDASCGLGICGPPNNIPSSCVGGVETLCQPGPAGIEGPQGDPTCIDDLDNDCDGATDIADPDCIGCTDMDNDGFSPDGILPGPIDCGPIDCNDMDNTIFPGADETVCNGIDNDCDLAIDEDYMPMNTTCGIGVCASTGQTTCIGGVEGDTCVAGPPDEPTDVTCDGLDGDCDGQVDEDYIIDAVCGLGVCGPPNNTPSSCVSGVETLCQPGPQDEATDVTCDGVDGDCDGLIDEDFVIQTTTCGLGVCEASGLLECINQQPQDSCQPGTPGVEGPEGDLTCGDGADNDCDGLTDGADQDCGASAIPPPVNQNLGVNDARFNNLVQADCRFCHEGTNPDIVIEKRCSGTNEICTTDADCTGGEVCEDVTIKNRHHLLVLGNEVIPAPSLIFVGTCSVTGNFCRNDGECIVGETCLIPWAPVDGDLNGDTIPDTEYECNSCHPNDRDTPANEFPITRDCTRCHIQYGDERGEGTVHHLTATASGQDSPIGDPNVGDCTPCHGELVDDTGDGHVIPTYDPSLVTPRRSDGLGPLNSYLSGRGACNFCHDQDTMPPASPVSIFNNEINHHSTGFYDQGVCNWCHDFGLPMEQQIRVCENCHGYESLHNIQTNSDATGDVDTDGDGVPDTPNIDEIIQGAENQWFGHVGNPEDCNGCHGGHIPASAPGTGPIIPYISGYTVHVMTAGTDKEVTLTGSAFTNYVGAYQWTSVVRMTASDGSSITLDPDTIDEGSLTVTIPGTTAPGNYDLRVAKDDGTGTGNTVDSNPVALAVIPNVAIASVDCNKKRGMIVVMGTGFGDKPDGTDADLNLQVDGQTAELISWTDTQIKGSVDRCSNRATVTVNAVFGSATDGKPCKGKKCR